MNVYETKAERERLLAIAKRTAQDAAVQLKSSQLTAIVRYLQMLGESEMVRCSTLEDHTLLRRAQGSAATYGQVIELLEYEMIETQSSVVQQVV